MVVVVIRMIRGGGRSGQGVGWEWSGGGVEVVRRWVEVVRGWGGSGKGV